MKIKQLSLKSPDQFNGPSLKDFLNYIESSFSVTLSKRYGADDSGNYTLINIST